MTRSGSGLNEKVTDIPANVNQIVSKTLQRATFIAHTIALETSGDKDDGCNVDIEESLLKTAPSRR
jgi:hypothetical protein